MDVLNATSTLRRKHSLSAHMRHQPSQNLKSKLGFTAGHTTWSRTCLKNTRPAISVTATRRYTTIQARTDTNDDVRRVLRLPREVVLDDLLRARSIPRLRVERRARVVRRHAVAAPERVLRVPPRVVARRGLDVPHVARVPGELPGLERRGDVLGVADRAARGVDEPRALLEVREEAGVDQVQRAFVQGRVDRDDVALDWGSVFVRGVLIKEDVPARRSP